MKDNLFHTQLEKQAVQQAKAHQTDLKNMKSLAIRESVEFVKRSSKGISANLTKEYRHIACQFLTFKNNTFDKMD